MSRRNDNLIDLMPGQGLDDLHHLDYPLLRDFFRFGKLYIERQENGYGCITHVCNPGSQEITPEMLDQAESKCKDKQAKPTSWY